jgi:hypothetical protein
MRLETKSHYFLKRELTGWSLSWKSSGFPTAGEANLNLNFTNFRLQSVKVCKIEAIG